MQKTPACSSDLSGIPASQRCECTLLKLNIVRRERQLLWDRFVFIFGHCYNTQLMKKTFLYILIIIVCIYGAYLLFLLSPLYVENYCSTKAKAITGNNGNKQVPMTTADVKQASILQGNTSRKISRQLSEELKCEREHGLIVF